MIKKITRKLLWFSRFFLAKFGVKRRYMIGNVYIKLDYTHNLPDYQKEHRFYDRFLPHLVKYLPSHSVVVDVGANVGDTLSGMAGKKTELEYVCVEADPKFYSDLKDNLVILKRQIPSLKVHSVNKFVGKEIDNVKLEGVGGTKHAEFGGKIRSQTLGKILSDINVKSDSLSLLKTDVDGFDYDVIRSAYDTLAKKPFLYFECQYDNENQLSGYKELFRELKNKGYERFSLFDNFGQYICTVENIEELDDLLDYVARQNFYDGSRSYFYYDVLAFSAEDSDQIKKIIEDYVAT